MSSARRSFETGFQESGEWDYVIEFPYLLNDALDQLEPDRPDAAEVANLRYFAGLSIQETALHLNVSVRTVNRHWAYAKAFLFRNINQ